MTNAILRDQSDAGNPKHGTLLNKYQILVLSLIGVLSVWAEYPTVTLEKTIGKVKDGKADPTGSYSKTWEGQAPYWPGGIPPGPCTNYIVKSGVTMRVPATTTEGNYPFLGETLLVQSKGTLAYTSCREPAVVSFKAVTFEDSTLFGSWTTGYAEPGGGVLQEYHSVLEAPVTIQGEVAIKTDGNTARGTKWKGSVKGNNDASLNIVGPTTVELTKEYHRHHVRFESDMSGFYGSITIGSNTIVCLGEALNGNVAVRGGGVLERLPGDGVAGVKVKSLTLDAGSRLSLRLDSTTGAHLPVTVKDSLSVAGPVEVTFKAMPPEPKEPTDYKVLTFPASAEIDETSFVFCGILGERDAYNAISITDVPLAKLHVEPDEGGSTKTLYALVRPRVNLMVSQTQVWNADPSDWSDGKTPHADADYFINGKTMRGDTSATYYTMHSLTLDSSESRSLGAIQFRTTQVSEFPYDGLYLNWGRLYNYCGGGSLKSLKISEILGKVFVGSVADKPVYFDPANNAFAGFRFLTSFAGGTDAAVVLKGSYASTSDHRSFAQYEFPSNTTEYCGSFSVQTNAVLAIGKDGFPAARATVEGGTLANAAGSIAALSPTDGCTIGELEFTDLGAIECRVDPNTGDCGTIRVQNRLTLPTGGKVQVYFSAFPKRSNRAAYENGFPVLTLAADATGELAEGVFEFAGIIDTSAGAKQVEGSFKVVMDESSGDRTLFFIPATKGLILLLK